MIHKFKTGTQDILGLTDILVLKNLSFHVNSLYEYLWVERLSDKIRLR